MKGIGRTFSARNIRRFWLSLIAISFLCIFWLCMKSQANWQRWAFLNADFRSQSPTTGNIIYALFGDGTTWSTAYTRNWTGSCIPTSIQHLLSSFNGGPLNANTIYIINSGNYTLSSNITFNGNCIALVGSGDVIINWSNKSISVNTNDVIVDNIQLYSGSSTTAGFLINGSTNATFNNIQWYSSLNNWLIITGGASFINIDNSQFYNNQVQGISVINSTHATINNTLVYNNGNNGIEFITASENSLNNSQSFNNANVGVYIDTGSNIIHNSMIYNNAYGIFVENPWINYINNVSIYNNSIWIFALTGELDFFGTIKLFSNTNDTWWPWLFNTNPWSGPITSWSAAGSFDTTDPGLDYDRVTNPKNGSNSFLLSGGLTPPQWWQSFNATSRPIRYIFGLHILKQLIPVSYSQGWAVEYGNDLEDFDSSKYIAELDSVLPPAQQTIINQYFWSGSMYTQNRQNNGCSLSSFQVVNLPGNIMGFNSPIYLQDHTIYILTGWTDEYRFIRNSPTTSFFVFSGDCIAVVGNANTRITADAHNLVNMFYANNQRNLIIDSVKIDGKYYGNGWFNVTGTLAGINFDGTTNNSTINNTQVYNNKEYWIAFGIGSHDNTILNAQLFNNGIAGIYLYYSSNYNVINNTQTYNNSWYGIRFANGSIRNTMNNFQSYNNDIGLFGDMTTKENVINNALIYNNSTAWIYFKNSSGNILNHVWIYNNKVGIKTAYSSLNNTYYDTLTMFGNWSGDFNGTNGSDMYFAQGTNGGVPFTTPWLSGWGLSMSCVYTTNPTLVSGNNLTLLTGNCDATRVNSGFKNQNDMNVNYTFWLNIYKQVQPFRYDSGWNLLPILDQYDTSKYIAEVFPIRVTFPEGLDTWVSLSSTGNYQLNTGYTTNIYIVNGINTPVTGSLTLTPSSASWHLIINNTPVGMTGVINDGDSIQVWLLSSTGFDQTITWAVTIGTSGPRPLTLTTRDPSVSPTTGSFNFLNISGVQINTYTGSTVTVNGIETWVSASISFLPPLTSGWLEIYSGNNFLYSWTTGLVFNGNKVKVVVKSSAQYGDIITWTVFIGLGSGSFTVQTLPDIYAPIIAFIDDVTPWYWADSINIYFSGANALSGYIFVNAPALCNTGMSTTGIVPYTTGFTVTVPLYNGQYVCAYGRDLGNNISTLVSSSAFNVAGLYFADGVETWPVAYDLV